MTWWSEPEGAGVVTATRRVRAAVFGAAFVLAAVMLGGCSLLATKGTMPPPGPNGKVDAGAAPDFIAVAWRDDSIVGYVRKEALLPPESAGPGRPSEPPWPVYAEDLRTIVGELVPGKGFIPLGVDPAAVPNIPVEQAPSNEPASAGAGQVTLYVSNDGAAEAWLAIVDGGPPMSGTGFPGGSNIGVGCFAMPSGSRLVLLDRAPQQPGAIVVRTIYTRGQELVPPVRSLEIAEDGRVMQGSGVPPWWSSEPQGC